MVDLFYCDWLYFILHLRMSALVTSSKCTKRGAEIQSSLKDKLQTVTVEQRTLKLATPTPVLKAEVGNEIQFQRAMQRRGFAYDQCRLINHETHEQWLQVLLNNITKDVPAGFARVSIEQALRGDREMFTLMAQEISGSLRATPTGELPMDQKMKAFMFDPRITMHLLPLPKGVAKQHEPTSSTADKAEQDPGAKPKTQEEGQTFT